MGLRGPIADPDGARAKARARQEERKPLVATGSATMPDHFSDAEAEAWRTLTAAMRSVGREPSDFDAPLLEIAAQEKVLAADLGRSVRRAKFKKGVRNPLFSDYDKAAKRLMVVLEKLGLTASSQVRMTGKAITGTAARPGQGRAKTQHVSGGDVYLDDLESLMCADLPS